MTLHAKRLSERQRATMWAALDESQAHLERYVARMVADARIEGYAAGRADAAAEVQHMIHDGEAVKRHD